MLSFQSERQLTHFSAILSPEGESRISVLYALLHWCLEEDLGP